MTEIPSVRERAQKRVNEIVKSDAEFFPSAQSPMEIIAQAVHRGAGEKELETLERMFEFDLKIKEQQAREAFNKAFANASLDMPEVPKDKVNKAFRLPDGNHPKYSSLGMMVQVLKPHMAIHGFRFTFPSPEIQDNIITASCKLTHELGHSETTKQSVPVVKPPGGERSAMNAQHAYKATITYLRSTALEGAMGIVGSEGTFDSDGNTNGEIEDLINDQQYADIQALLQETKKSEKLFCRVLKIESIDKLPESRYDEAIAEIEKFRN